MAVLGWLIEARESLGLSQGELAVRLGSTQASVSRWEAGSRQPPEGLRERVAELGVGGVVSAVRNECYPGAPEDPAARLAWFHARSAAIAGGGAKVAVDAAGGGSIGAGKAARG